MSKIFKGYLVPTLSMLALLNAACGGGGGSAATNEAMKYIPEGSQGIVVLDVKKLMSSPALSQEPLKSQIDKLKSDGDFKQLLDTGIDPFTNVEAAIIAVNVAKKDAAFVLKGTFDAAKAAEKLKAEMKDEKDFGVEVIGSNLLIVGSKEAVTSAKAGKGIDGSPDVKALLSLTDKSKPIYGAGTIPAELTAGAPLPQLKSIKGIAGWFDPSAGVDMLMVARFDTDANATATKGMIDGYLPMATAIGIPADVMKGVKIEAKGADLHISVKLSQDQIKSLSTMAAGMMGGMGGMTPPAPAPAPAPAPEAPPAP